MPDSPEITHFPGGGQKHAKGKLRVDLVPRDAIRQVAVVMEKALEKYTEDSWKNCPEKLYGAATYRHLLDYLDDPTGVDHESGLPHYAHVAASAMILCALAHTNNNEDIEERR